MIAISPKSTPITIAAKGPGFSSIHSPEVQHFTFFPSPQQYFFSLFCPGWGQLIILISKSSISILQVIAKIKDKKSENFDFASK